jgi:hypothetical protein
MPSERRKAKHAISQSHGSSEAAPSPPVFRRVLERHSGKLALALVLIATLRIAATHSVFSPTSDEPAHVACGMEWLERGVYRIEAQHPPLARIAGAVGPYLLGRRLPADNAQRHMYQQGQAIYDGSESVLTASRLGILPFFWLAAWVVWAWSKRDFGAEVALSALFLFTMLPPVLAHAGLATTDMALTACLGAAFLAGRVWIEQPSARSGAIFGACGALAVLAKFSSLVFFPAAAGAALVCYAAAGRLRLSALKNFLPSFAVALATLCAIVWGVYRFSLDPLFRGIGEVILHNSQGHLNYLFGSLSRDGFLHFYPVVLAVKTPIAFLALVVVGAATLPRKWRQNPALLLPAAYAVAILAVALFSRINIGVRHILPIYTGLSIVAGAGLLRLAESAREIKWAAGGLLAWLTVASLAAHPDYLPYFNELAGAHPENILVDSDLDWGQDIKRLERLTRERGVQALSLGISTHLPERHGLPALQDVDKTAPLAGWTAIGFTAWKQFRLGYQDTQPGAPVWPDRIPPREIVGKSIALWYFPPGQ